MVEGGLVTAGLVAICMALIELIKFLIKKAMPKPNPVAGLEKRFTVMEDQIDDIYNQSEDLHTWHSPDSSGEQSWKNRHMMELVTKMAAAVDNNSRVLERLIPILERLERKN